MRRNAADYPQKAAVIFNGKTVSWRELNEKVEKATPFFNRRLGNSVQQPVALLFPNSIDFIVVYLAILNSGHMALPLDPAYKKLELEAILDQLGVRLAITDDLHSHLIDGSRTQIEMIDSLGKPGPKAAYLRMPAVDQVASLTFTSGTTSIPKAVPNTHANHLWNIKVCSKVWEWTEQDSLLVNVPLSHMLGVVMGISGAIYHANTIYLYEWFDAQQTLKALSSGQISFFTHAASAYVKLVQAADEKYDLSKVRLCVSGAAPLPPAVWQEFKDRFGIEIRETYGSSETGRIAANRIKDKPVSGSPGRVLPEVDLKISPAGEVLIKSPGVFPGYYKSPAATQKSKTSDGYWRTGDIGELIDGYLFLKGRKQERIRRFGYTVSPRDIEWAMHKMPGIEDVYALGRQKPGQPDDQLVYFLVSKLNDDQIMDYCKNNLLFAWRPDRIIRLDEMPRTRSGKIKISALEQMLGEAA